MNVYQEGREKNTFVFMSGYGIAVLFLEWYILIVSIRRKQDCGRGKTGLWIQ